MDATHLFGRANHDARALARHASPWIERIARFGYVCKGVVYMTVGVLALRAATGEGRVTDTRGAFGTILQQPFGQALLIAIAIGLAGYTVWQLTRALFNPEGDRGAKGVALRIKNLASGAIHGGLAFSAYEIASHARRAAAGGAQSPAHWSAEAMAHPGGRWAVGLVGGAVIAGGIVQLVRAARATFRKKLETARMSATEQTFANVSGRLGIAARGVVFGLIGLFLVRAAQTYDPSQAHGLAGALRELQVSDAGPVALGAVAVGFVAYGFFMLVQARFRRIRPA